MRTLCFLATGSLSTYQDIGIDDLYDYYNPCHYFDQVICVSPYPEKYKEIQGIKIISVTSAEEYKKVLREVRPDVVRAYGAFYSSDYANYYKVEGIPVITSVHDVVKISPSVRYSEKVICMSEAVCNEVKKIGVNQDRVLFMPNRVDTSLFSCKKRSYETEAIRKRFPMGKFILDVARKCEQKNTDTVVKALKYLPAEYFCVFVGRGDERYIHLAETEGVSSRCYWIDHINKSELPFWYSAADCFCLPSRWEGFGIVFIEAAACGVPIVSSDKAPMNEFLNSDNSILIGDYTNPQKIADGIIRACTSKEIYRLVSKASDMAKKYSKDSIDQREMNIYKSFLEEYKDDVDIPAFPCIFDSPIFIWGVGNKGRQIYTYLSSKNIKIKGFVDSDVTKRRGSLFGYGIKSPDALKSVTFIIPNDYYQEVYKGFSNSENHVSNQFIDFNFLKASYKEL